MNTKSINDSMTGSDTTSFPIVESLVKGQARNRSLAALTTRESVTWTTGINEVTITVLGEAGGTAGFLGSVAVAFDAPSSVVADTWLTHADNTTTDAQLYVIMVGQTRTFYFGGAGITRIDAKKLYGGEAAMAVIFEAA